MEKSEPSEANFEQKLNVNGQNQRFAFKSFVFKFII